MMASVEKGKVAHEDASNTGSKSDGTTIHQRIRIVYEASQLTQHEFAESIGIAQSHLSGLMKNRNPSKKVITRICEEWGCNNEWLKNGIGERWRKHPQEKLPPELSKVINYASEVFGQLGQEEIWEASAKMMRVLKEYNTKK